MGKRTINFHWDCCALGPVFSGLEQLTLDLATEFELAKQPSNDPLLVSAESIQSALDFIVGSLIDPCAMDTNGEDGVPRIANEMVSLRVREILAEFKQRKSNEQA